MTMARTRSTVAAAILSALVLLTSVLPGQTTSQTAAVEAAVRDATVLVTGALDDVAAAVTDAGGRVVGHLPLFGTVVAEVPSDGITAIDAVPGVMVTENAPVQLESAQDSAVEHPADDQGPRTLKAHQLWRDGIDGTGIGIAVLDTGVSEVDELAGRVVGGVDLTWEQDGVDSYGHGTPVASLAAGSTTGVAPGAHVVPVKIAGEDGMTDIARLLIGLDWIARHAGEYDIRVVNLSLGSTPIAVDLVDAAVQRLWDLGLVVVVAAGNDGPDTLGTPAGNTHVITVGATQGQDTKSINDDVIAPWSANGVDVDGNAKPDVVAPGQSVVAAGSIGSWAYDEHPEGHLGDGLQRVSGTSFSTGLVSGAAALILDAHPDWTPDEVLGQLVETGRRTTGTDAPTPRLHRAVDTTSPVVANGDASETTEAALQELMDLGPPDPITLFTAVGDVASVFELGSGWYGSGWYGSGWYETDWFGSGWYGSGWYGSGWYGSGWYGSGWYGSGWYGSGWYGSGWYGSGWYGSGWYGSGWA